MYTFRVGFFFKKLNGSRVGKNVYRCENRFGLFYGRDVFIVFN